MGKPIHKDDLPTSVPREPMSYEILMAVRKLKEGEWLPVIADSATEADRIANRLRTLSAHNQYRTGEKIKVIKRGEKLWVALIAKARS